MNEHGAKLARKTLAYLIGSLSSKLLSFILVPLYAFTVSAADLGNYDYIITLANIVVPVVYIVMWDAILKFALVGKELTEKIIATSGLFILVISGALFIASVPFFGLIYNFGVNPFYVACVFTVYGLLNAWQYYARALKQESTFVLSSVLAAASSLILNIVTVAFLHMGLSGLVISYVLSNLVCIGVIEYRIRLLQRLKLENFDKKLFKSMFLFSAPLVLNAISGWILSGAGKAIVIDRLGSDANGMYTFASKFSMFITLLGGVINMAFTEESIIHSKDDTVDKNFLRTVQHVFTLFLVFLLALVPAVNIFYKVISSTEYFESRMYFPLTLLYALFATMATNVGAIFHVVNMTKYAFVTTLAGAITFLVICLATINICGIFAVVIAQVVGAMVMFSARYVFARRRLGYGFQWYKIILLLMAYAVIVVVCHYSSVTLNLAIFIAVSAIVCMLNLRLLKHTVSRIIRKLRV